MLLSFKKFRFLTRPENFARLIDDPLNEREKVSRVTFVHHSAGDERLDKLGSQR